MVSITSEIKDIQSPSKDENPAPIVLEITELLKKVQPEDSQNLVITEDLFTTIKEKLNLTIDNMEKTPSYISRAAEFWGKLPLWQKILGGVASTLPTLVLGIIFNISFLLVICCITTLAYAGIGIALDDHHKNKVSGMKSLKDGIFALAGFLEKTIKALDQIRQDMADQISKFTEENTRLKHTVNSLESKVKLLDIEIEAATEVSASLKKTKEGLEEVAEQLTSKVSQQTYLLETNQQELQGITQAYDASQALLAEKIAELEGVKTDLGVQLDQAKTVAQVLQDTVLALSRNMLTSEGDRQLFQKKLDEFLTDTHNNFGTLAESFSETQKKLALTEEKLKQLVDQYEARLKELNQQIERLTLISAEKNKKPSDETKKPADHLSFFPPAANGLTTQPLLEAGGQNKYH